MELVTILHKASSAKEAITPERTKLLCNNLCRLDAVAAKSAYNVILAFRKRIDTIHTIGSSFQDIPYFGEHLEDVGILFSASELPSRLLIMLEVMIESADILDVSPWPELDGDDETPPGFILTEVKPATQLEVPNTHHHARFVMQDEEDGVSFHTKQTYDGYKIRIADTSRIIWSGGSEKNVVRNCFWDGQEFDGEGVKYPKRYIYENGVHHFSGHITYCDLPCLYAHMCEISKLRPCYHPVNFDKSMDLVMLMFNLLYPNEEQIWAAPERSMLDIHGGPYTIEQFRRVDGKKRFVDSHNISCDLQKSTFFEL